MNSLFFVPAIFISWVIATYLLEGRLGEAASLDQQGRIAYIIVANMAIGTIFASFVLWGLLKQGLLQIHHTGFENFRNSRIKISVSAIVGIIIFCVFRKTRWSRPSYFCKSFFSRAFCYHCRSNCLLGFDRKCNSSVSLGKKPFK